MKFKTIRIEKVYVNSDVDIVKNNKSLNDKKRVKGVFTVVFSNTRTFYGKAEKKNSSTILETLRLE